MIYKRLCSFILLFGLLLGLAGCKPDDFKLYYEIQNEITTVDPQLAKNDSELLLTKNMFEGLYRLNAEGKPVSGTAECEISNNGRKYTFSLRKNAVWFDGTPLTADDFAFGIERALTHATGSPYAQALFCIQNAREFNLGRVSFDQVGIHVLSDRSLAIILDTENADFPAVLASSCAMPCNRSFFKSTNGRYGLDKNSILSNGSFYLQFWDEENGLTLHKDEDYNGNFVSNAYAINLSVGKDSNAAGRLLEENIDGGRILYNEESRLPATDFTIQKFPVSTYSLIFNANVDAALRRLFIQSVDFKAIRAELMDCMTAATTLIPPTLPNKGGAIQYPAYNPTKARQQFLQYAKKQAVPTLNVLCVRDSNVSNLLKKIISYWQNNLGAYGVNIEYMETEAELLERLQTQNYSVALAPFQDSGGKVYDFLYPFSAISTQNYLSRRRSSFDTYLSTYAGSNNDADLQKALNALSSENVVVPICSVNKIYALASEYKNAVFYNYGGEIDFSMLKK